MDAAGQVILVLKLLLFVGPVAVYFIALGLVNSQATPKIINARSDFLALTVALCPLLFWPIPSLIRAGLGWVVFVAGAVAAVGISVLLDRVRPGWVIYNLSDYRARRLLDRALRSLGWEYAWEDNRVRVDQPGLLLTLSPLPLLRNVSIHVEATTIEQREAASQLRQRFSALLSTQQLLPSVGGSCLFLLGVGLLMLPFWMMSRHSDAIAEVVTRWLMS
jgi:hypothetical protein